MSQKEQLRQLINPNAFQVFLLTSPGNVPLSFAVHPWFVLNNQGILSRWEILFRKNQCATSWGHLHKNFLPPFSGVEIITSLTRFCWKAKVLGVVEGELANRMIAFIERSPELYRYNYQYSLLGANSDSYAQWVLNHFPEWKIVLPWNAFGKNFKFNASD